MPYKVWVEIEQLDDEGDTVAEAGDLGVLPDPLGTFDTLEEARACQAAALAALNPSELVNSDAVDH